MRWNPSLIYHRVDVGLGCTYSEFFGQNKGLSKRDSVANKLLHIIHTHGIEMVLSSFGYSFSFRCFTLTVSHSVI
jgi:hypothetical protein